jgi:hypothetical protein
MTVMDQASTLGFPPRIETKDDTHCFSPVRVLSRSVKQAEVGHEMPLIVRRDLVT